MTDPRPVTQWPGGDPAKDAARVAEVIAEREDAFNRGDADLFDRRFTADVVVVNAAGRRFEGWAEIHAYHAARLGSRPPGVHTRLTVLASAFPGPGTAVVHTSQLLTTPDGERTTLGTWTMAERDGEWWICSLQQTAVAPQG
ncbi:YybH family protein [Nocardiopsis sediminis]|uniref:YybH family protein n=1 Tax=Nocardiopsis sediminis TaxID=1778267 RepID=A0ABV8FKD6_9ACTN